MTLCQFISSCIIQSIPSLLFQSSTSSFLQPHYYLFYSEHLHIPILRMPVRLCLHNCIFLLAKLYLLISLLVRLEFSMSVTPLKLLSRKRYVYFYPTGLALRLIMSYIYGAPILDVSRSHTTTQHSR